jgi:hypothetical protein
VSCHAEEVVFAGHKTTVIFCGEDNSPQPCATCQVPDAPWLCDWPVLKRVEVPISVVEVGDIWVTGYSGRHGRVVRIENLDINSRPTEAPNYVSRNILVAIPGTRNPYSYNRYRDVDTATTLQPGTCDAPCCDRHAREVDENVHYCVEHWNSWEALT